MKTLLDKINLNQIDDQLFDTTAEQIAQAFGTPYKVEKNNRTKEPKDANKSSQIRRFYEDLLNWETQLNRATSKKERDQKYAELLPLIKMLNAKVAYAHGRDTVDDQFRDFINHCIRQLTPDQPNGFKHFKLLFEAVIGFMKNKA
ncbi:type III-A CRISPR-associated protein Csm2 [Thiomicrospira sp. R3]|uniref:type III-A CRISPR-associated protein Csm2 n=1 Tax=Thiomicrospira sp. R3 TaxID=3035472 RepID=UPI00259BEFFF|nr:type III-A CRISPR-associated protein Csm2 [Thiomicrospira sp. R3]WFE69476.1 type III-A CRISPR-associated protein Csm2 [Thiomicrospira sp. R3]